MKLNFIYKKMIGKTMIFFFSAIFVAGLSGSLCAEVEEARVHNDIWSGYWWPIKDGELINPLSKYDKVTGKKAADWERKNNPPGPNVPEWYGYCHAWAASSVMEKEPQKNRKYKRTVFSIGDQKGLLAASHANDVSNSYGERFEGEGTNPDDIAPDQLWMVLRRHIQKQGIPIILDVEAGTPVWNYPVFAYRVTYNPVESGSSVYQAEMELWLADDGVPQDFVGLQKIYLKYDFQVEIRNGSVVLGTGKWLGESKKAHPDFAWFPYVVVPESPEVDYNLVCKILGSEPASAPRPATRPQTPAVAAAAPESTPATTTPATTTPATQSSAETSVSDGMTLDELRTAVKGKKSNWTFDISVNKFDGGQYKMNELISISGKSEKEGYLYLISIAPDQSISLLYPRYSNEDNKIKGNEDFEIPSQNAKFQFRLTGERGTHHIHGIISEKKLAIKGLQENEKLDELHWTPSLQEQVQELLPEPVTKGNPDQKVGKVQTGSQTEAPSKTKLSQKIGRFAQDEVSFILLGKNKK